MATCFGPFTLDSETRQLRRNRRVIHLSPKAFDLLVTLLDERPRILSKADLQERLWPDTFVAEANLANLVAEVRKALGDRAQKSRFLRTAHGRGYAFCGEAATTRAPLAAVSSSLRCSLTWGQQQFRLGVGEHLIGRDESADVRLDASTVSRRHARLLVGPDGVRLEDLGSKNGTFRAADRLTAAAQLLDGDVVRIGSLVLTIHVARPLATTDTAV
jgi:DNA-binding winged helix-turn-helix (wHTH) protein